MVTNSDLRLAVAAVLSGGAMKIFTTGEEMDQEITPRM